MILFIKENSARNGPEERINDSLPEKWPGPAQGAAAPRRAAIKANTKHHPLRTAKLRSAPDNYMKPMTPPLILTAILTVNYNYYEFRNTS